MGACGIEKPMLEIGGKHVVERVVEAVRDSPRISRVIVSVSPNTPETERFLRDAGVETIRTSGEDFMQDIHESFSVMDGKYVMTCPSDIPLITTGAVSRTVERFLPEMQSMIVLVSADVVRSMGITPSYTRSVDGQEWVLSGVSVMDREATLRGEYLNEEYLLTGWKELAVNVNTQTELALAREMF